MSPPHVDAAQAEQDAFSPDENMRIANYETVETLRETLVNHGLTDSTIPNLLFVIIRRGSWRHRLDPVTNVETTMKPSEFRRFITDPPRIGLGQDFDELKARFCQTPLLLDEWDRATVGKQGSDGESNNPTGLPAVDEDDAPNRNTVTVRPEPRRGNDAQYALRRLRTQAPELHARVLAGEMSPHRAMIEAGFRDRVVQLPLDPDKAIRVLRKHFTAEQLETLLARASERE